MGEQITPFIMEETKEDNNNNNVNNEKQLLEETFFVENINLRNALVARIWNVSVRQHQIPLCEFAQAAVSHYLHYYYYYYYYY